MPPPIVGLAFGAPPGDKAFDIDWPCADLDARGAVAVIPPRAGHKAPIASDRAVHRWCHPAENRLAKFKDPAHRPRSRGRDSPRQQQNRSVRAPGAGTALDQALVG